MGVVFWDGAVQPSLRRSYLKTSKTSKTGAIDYVVQLKTKFGENVKGNIFNYDRKGHALTLKEPADSPKQTFRTINTEYIDTINIISKPEIPPNLELEPYNIQNIQAFERKALHAATEDAKKLELV